MKIIQHIKIPATLFALATILLIACNSAEKEAKITSDSSNADTHAHTDSVLSNNEVKAEAPDAAGKKEQGYAYPRQTDNFAQSPIDIISGETDKAGKEAIAFTFHSEINDIENLGHTIELEFKEGSKCTVNGKDYETRQFHFHTPSEHLVDGVTFPMEMHTVSVLHDSANKDSYLVLAVLFKIGAENKFLKEFLDKVPGKEGEKTALSNGEVKLDDLLSQFSKNDIKSYYMYKGSLTTPPFSETVQWVIMKHVVEASESQIMTIEKMEGNNARHVQAINKRKVYSL